MKFSTLATFVILVLMLVVPLWFIDNKNLGSPAGLVDPSSMEELKAKTPKDVKTVVTDKRVEIYTWRDKNGVPQFSEKLPGEDYEVEKIVLSPDTNVMDPVKVPEEEARVVQKPNVITLGSPYSPDGIKDIVNGAVDLQEQANQQQTEQQKMIEEILKSQK